MKKRLVCMAMVILLLCFHGIDLTGSNIALAWRTDDPNRIRAGYKQNKNDRIEATFSIDVEEYTEYLFDIHVEGIMVIVDWQGTFFDKVQISSNDNSCCKATVILAPMGQADTFDLYNPSWTIYVSAKRDGFMPVTYEETLHLQNEYFDSIGQQIHNSYTYGTRANEYRPDIPVVVSMGDSYASGEGCPPFYGSGEGKSALVLRETADWLAHRSMNSWSGQLTFTGADGKRVPLNALKDANWFFTAVSGATTSNIAGQQSKDYSVTEGVSQNLTAKINPFIDTFSGSVLLPAQITVFDEIKHRTDPVTGKPLKVDYVTLSLGGNDVDFGGDLGLALGENQHILGTDYNNLRRFLFSLPIPMLQPYLQSLLNKAEFAPFLQDKIDNLMQEFNTPDNVHDKLYQAYLSIIKAAGPQAKIIITGYPELLDTNIEQLTFSDPDDIVNNPGIDPRAQQIVLFWYMQGGKLFSYEDAKILNNASVFLNEEIQKIIEDLRSEGMNIYFVPIAPAFAGHGAYSDAPWINPVILPALNDDINWWPPLSAYSIHPNLKGVCAYAGEVQKMIDKLEVEAEITGCVDFTDKNGERAESGSVEIVFTPVSGPDNPIVTTTNDDGNYTTWLPRNEYTVSIRLPNSETYFSLNDEQTFRGKSPFDWQGNGTGSFICRDRQYGGLLMRINCIESCSQAFTVYALEKPQNESSAPAASSLDELIEVYIRSIQDVCEGTLQSDDLPGQRGISMLVGQDALDTWQRGEEPCDELGYMLIEGDEESMLLIGNIYDNEGLVHDAYVIRDGVPRLFLRSTDSEKYYFDLIRATVRGESSEGTQEYMLVDYQLVPFTEDDFGFCNPEWIGLIPFSYWGREDDYYQEYYGEDDYYDDDDYEYDEEYLDDEDFDYEDDWHSDPDMSSLMAYDGPVPEAYRPLLESYTQAAALGSDNDALEGTLWNWIHWLFNGGMDNGSGLENVIGFAFYDLDGDSSPELILGTTELDDVIGECVMQVFTIVDGQPIMLLDYQEDLVYAELTMDGLICVSLAVPMDEDSITTAYYRVNAGQLEFVEGYGESGYDYIEETGNNYLLSSAQAARTGDFMHETHIDQDAVSDMIYRHLGLSNASAYIQPLSQAGDLTYGQA